QDLAQKLQLRGAIRFEAAYAIDAQRGALAQGAVDGAGRGVGLGVKEFARMDGRAALDDVELERADVVIVQQRSDVRPPVDRKQRIVLRAARHMQGGLIAILFEQAARRFAVSAEKEPRE